MEKKQVRGHHCPQDVCQTEAEQGSHPVPQKKPDADTEEDVSAPHPPPPAEHPLPAKERAEKKGGGNLHAPHTHCIGNGERNEREIEEVMDALRSRVHHGNKQEQPERKREEEGRKRLFDEEQRKEEEKCGPKLDERVEHANGSSTVTTAPGEKAIAHERDELSHPEHVLASGAAGPAAYVLPRRETRDQHGAETPEHKTKNPKKNG